MLDGLYEKLNAYARTDFYPFHMPGHKRNPETGPLAPFYRLDITEIDGFDNLHAASGVIRQHRSVQRSCMDQRRRIF